MSPQVIFLEVLLHSNYQSLTLTGWQHGLREHVLDKNEGKAEH